MKVRKNKIGFLVTFSIALLVTLRLEADRPSVDHQTGALTIRATDAIDDFQVKREYSSRSIHRGWFGLGWCSNLDYVLNFNSDGSLSLLKCDSIVQTFVKSSTKIFRVPNRLNQTIISKEDKLFWSNGSRETYVFNASGSLLGIQVDARWLIVTPKQSSMATVQMQINDHLNLITELRQQNHRIQYNFIGLDLVGVTNTKGISETYDYDNAQNLLRQTQDQSIFNFEYDQDNDRLTKIVFPDGSFETILYKITKNKDLKAQSLEVHQIKSTFKQQKLSQTNIKTSIYHYQQTKFGQFNLTRSQISTHNGIEPTEILYNINGKPEYLRFSGKAFRILYSAEQKISEIRWNNESFLFFYNHPEGKLTSIIERRLNTQQIVSRATFQYDRFGHLSSPSTTKVNHPFDLNGLDSDLLFRQAVPFAPVRALAAIRGS